MMLPDMPSEAAALGVVALTVGDATRELVLDEPVGVVTGAVAVVEPTGAVVLPLEMSSVGPRLRVEQTQSQCMTFRDSKAATHDVPGVEEGPATPLPGVPVAPPGAVVVIGEPE